MTSSLNRIGLFLLAFTVGCKSNQEMHKYCNGRSISLNKAIKKPYSAKSVFLYNYYENIFPSEDFAKLSALTCLRIEGPMKSSLFGGNFDSIPVRMKFDTVKLANLIQLKSLTITNFYLNHQSSYISNLVNLAYLDVSHCFLDSIPQTFVKLKAIEFLNLRINHLEDIPQSLLGMEKLKSIDLGNNSLTSIPPILSEFKNLEEVSLLNPETGKKTKIGIDGRPVSENKINYKKELNSLTNLLAKPNIKRVYIEVGNKYEKKWLTEELKKVGFVEKAKIFYKP